MMKFQLALDVRTIAEAHLMMDAAGDLADLIEVGSPLVMNEGMQAVREVRRRFPDKPLLADCKIMDAVAWMAPKAYEAGADIVTVIEAAHDFTLQEHARVAHEYGKKAAVDLISCPTRDLAWRTKELADYGLDYFYMHAPSEALRPTFQIQHTRIKEMLKSIPHEKLCIAHSLDYPRLEEVLQYQPEFTVVSLPIMLNLEDPAKAREAALTVREIFDRCNAAVAPEDR